MKIGFMAEIAFVSERYSDKNFSSGGYKLNYILLQGLINKGLKVDLFTDNVISNEKKLFNKIYSISLLEKLRDNYSVVFSAKPNIEADMYYIHSHSFLYRKNKLYNVFSFLFYKLFNYSKYKKRLKIFHKTSECLKKAKKVIVSSQVLKEDVVNNYGVSLENVYILPPPIEKYELKEQEKNNVFTFGISATGFANKGGYLLFKSIKELKKRGYKFKVRFIYSSSNLWIKFLMKVYRIEEFCVFSPIYDDMSKFYYSIDCLLMPSYLEAFGMVATEALSTGCPVIVASHCGASDIIESGKNGFVFNFDKKTVQNLADYMETVLNLSNDRREKMKEYCIKSVEDLSAERFVEKIRDLLPLCY